MMSAGGIETQDVEIEAAAVEATKHAIYFVLEGANLEVAKVGKNYELLNCDDHANFLKRHGKDPASYRPDISHQVRKLDLILSKPRSCSFACSFEPSFLRSPALCLSLLVLHVPFLIYLPPIPTGPHDDIR
jgi:EMG1/NEP1 methyltransferase